MPLTTDRRPRVKAPVLLMVRFAPPDKVNSPVLVVEVSILSALSTPSTIEMVQTPPLRVTELMPGKAPEQEASAGEGLMIKNKETINNVMSRLSERIFILFGAWSSNNSRGALLVGGINGDDVIIIDGIGEQD